MEANPHGSTPDADSSGWRIRALNDAKRCILEGGTVLFTGSRGMCSARRWPTNWRPFHHRESDNQDAQASAQEAASKGMTEALSVENARKEADGVHCD
jgi:hypothetical protein